jgi:hypothetical protein
MIDDVVAVSAAKKNKPRFRISNGFRENRGRGVVRVFLLGERLRQQCNDSAVAQLLRKELRSAKGRPVGGPSLGFFFRALLDGLGHFCY